MIWVGSFKSLQSRPPELRSADAPLEVHTWVHSEIGLISPLVEWLMSHSTSGEIRPISLCTQVCTSSGASAERSSGGLDCSDLKLPTQIISATSFHCLRFGP